MDDPLALPVPDDLVPRIHAFARDLAHAAAHDFCSGTFSFSASPSGESLLPTNRTPDYEAVERKWDATKRPKSALLATFGYFESRSGGYVLTPKAFDLLSKPSTPPSVFISYKRDYSSTFGLLIECKLQSIGVQAFIDRSLDVGDEWHAQLETKVRRSKVFIVLLAPQTLESRFVCQEIKWALEEKVLIIPIWHSGFSEKHIPDGISELSAKHSIKVLEESAKAYHDALEELVNRLGYVTE